MHQLKKFVTYDDFKVALDVFAKETFTIWSLVDSLYTGETKTQYKRATFKCVHYKQEEAIKSTCRFFFGFLPEAFNFTNDVEGMYCLPIVN